jgi:N-methylhydantoinase B
VTIDGDQLVIDFDGTAPAVAGNVNCTIAVTRSACLFALRVLLPKDIPANAGSFAPLDIRVPERSLVYAQRPSAVVAGNVETSQRVADTVLLVRTTGCTPTTAGSGRSRSRPGIQRTHERCHHCKLHVTSSCTAWA